MSGSSHRSSTSARHRSSSCAGTPRPIAARPPIRVVPPRNSGRKPKMKLRMSRIVRWRVSMARSTRWTTSSGSSRDQLRDVLEREADGVDALDDPVVEVLADALALVDDGQPMDLLVQAGVLDRDRGVAGEGLDERLVGRGELLPRRLVGQVQVADRAALHRHRDAEEAVHRRMVRREPIASLVEGDVGDPERAVLLDDQAEEAVTARQVGRSAPGSRRPSRR